METKLGGRYEIIRELGAGAMGRVFQAVDLSTRKTVAVKVMLATSEAYLQALLRFQQEGALLSTLKHPNIVEVQGTFLEGEISCIIMEFLEGEPLSRLLHAGPMELPRIKALSEQVAAALEYAHGRGIIHRDVKPDNIMVLEGDRVKVTDFGIARLLGPGSALATATGQAIGTPLYMSPEQIEGMSVDGRTDIYSLGVVLYHMATGRPPFEGDDPVTIAFKHVHRPPPSPSAINGAIPADWEVLILKALEKDPRDRFQNMTAMDGAIRALSAGAQPASAASTATLETQKIEVPEAEPRSPEPRAAVPAPASDGPAVAPQSADSAPSSTRTSWPLLAAGAGVVIVALVAAFFLLRPGSSGSRVVSAGTLLASWGSAGSGASQLQAATGLGLDRVGNVYVADYDNNRVVAFTPTSEPLGLWPLAYHGKAVSAGDVAVDAQGWMYVVDTDGNRIMKLSSSGTVLASYGRTGTGPGRFRSPVSIAVDSRNNLYVVDQGNDRIQKLSSSGKPLAQWGRKGSSAGQFQFPVAVTLDSQGNLYVVDQSNYRVQKLSRTGRPLLSFGSQGKGPGQFEEAAGVAVDNHGHIYVGDGALGRVQVFSPSGKLLTSWGHPGSGAAQFRGLVDLAVDGSGNVYTLDHQSNRIQKFGPIR